MSQLVTSASYSWSYAGTNKAEPVHKFINPSKSEKCQINYITLYLGTINGKCTWGSTASGTGKPITTYASISGTKTDSKTVTNKVRTLSGAGGYYPDRVQINVAYTFTFSPAYVIPAGGSAILCIQTPTSNGSSNSSALAVNTNADRSNGHPITIGYDIIPNIAPDPGKVTISCDDFAANWINWKVTTSRAATHYEIFVDGQSKGTFTANSGTVYVTPTTDEASGQHSLYAKAKNNNSAWITSNTIPIDCTIPSIYNAGITVTGSSSGNLYFSSNYDIKYYLDNTYIGSAAHDVNVIKSVILANNTLKNYTLVVKRSDNTKISNSLVFKIVNTTVATISLTGKVSGTNLNYSANANKNCKDWIN